MAFAGSDNGGEVGLWLGGTPAGAIGDAVQSLWKCGNRAERHGQRGKHQGSLGRLDGDSMSSGNQGFPVGGLLDFRRGRGAGQDFTRQVGFMIGRGTFAWLSGFMRVRGCPTRKPKPLHSARGLSSGSRASSFCWRGRERWGVCLVLDDCSDGVTEECTSYGAFGKLRALLRPGIDRSLL
jgi:hypothetical protein